MAFLETTLDNGLRVVVQPAHTAPVVSCWIWCRAGVRNEHPGITGISHWVEHMLFKGTERWPNGVADQAISREGGVYNGMTWLDFTAFYESLPADRLDLALDIESDRMQRTRFTQEEVDAERPIIVSERQGNENSPLFLLSEEVTAAAYRVHPYGHGTIGHLCDLQAITRDDLEHYVQTYYAPNNALLTIAGDIDPQATVDAVAHAFGSIGRRADPPESRAVEPAQRGERRVVVEGAGKTDYVELVYHAPPADHPDFHALTVLNAILSGASGFLVGRGQITNYTSRLYGALVEAEHAVDVAGSLMPTIDPGLYRLTATVWPNSTLEAVSTHMEAEIAQLRDSPVSEAELAKAQRQAQALFAYSSESISNQAFWHGFSRIFADHTWLETYLDGLQAVTAGDVQRVAQTYLVPGNRTTGWYVGRNKDD
ncbi:MAG: insulinase family protein [Anaerolineae bacterium]|nr:insulinase family protein [Anaerolineae bacterium]